VTIVLLILAVVAVFRPTSVFRYVGNSIKRTLREWKVLGKFLNLSKIWKKKEKKEKKEKKVKATDEKGQPLN
jgi:hypothetical protein